jgi:SAM-dependent methyltransferase
MNLAETEHGALWDKRYLASDNPFGDEPSKFLVEKAHLIQSRAEVLSLGEGDGRHAVWLAGKTGARLTALDVSGVALKSAEKRARAHGIEIKSWQADLLTLDWPDRKFDAVIWFFAHFTKPDLPGVARGAWRALRPGGLLIGRLWAEHSVFSPEGPRDGGTTGAELLAALPEATVDYLADAGIMEGRGTPGGRPHRHTDFVLRKEVRA